MKSDWRSALPNKVGKEHTPGVVGVDWTIVGSKAAKALLKAPGIPLEALLMVQIVRSQATSISAPVARTAAEYEALTGWCR